MASWGTLRRKWNGGAQVYLGSHWGANSLHAPRTGLRLCDSAHKDMGVIFYNAVLDFFLLWGFEDILNFLIHRLGAVQEISCPPESSELVSKVPSNLLGKVRPPEIADLAGKLGKVP